MPEITVLLESELNKETSDDDLNQLLKELIAVTGENWQLIESTHTEKQFRFTRHKKHYELYSHVLGNQYQRINFRNDLLQYTPAEYVSAYMYGVISEAHRKPSIQNRSSLIRVMSDRINELKRALESAINRIKYESNREVDNTDLINILEKDNVPVKLRN